MASNIYEIYEETNMESNKMKIEKKKPIRQVKVNPDIRGYKKPIISVNNILREVVAYLDPLEIVDPDQQYIYEILTDPRGYNHRNSTYKRKVIKNFTQILIDMGKL